MIAHSELKKLGAKLGDCEYVGGTSNDDNLPILKTIQEAEMIQDEFIKTLENQTGSESSAAWKIGASNFASRQALSLDEIFLGYVPSSKIVQSGEIIASEQIRQFKIEGEIAVKLSNAVEKISAMPDLKWDDSFLLNCVQSVHSAMEIPQSRFPTLNQHGPKYLVADNGAAGWVVVGPESDKELLLNWENRSARIDSQNCTSSEPVEFDGSTNWFFKSPLAILRLHLQQRLKRNLLPVPNEIILLGAVTPCIDTAPNDQIVVHIDGFYSTQVAFSDC